MQTTQEIAPGVGLTTALDEDERARTSVVTRMTCDAPLERVWSALMFYEQIDEQPPFYLRWLLPVPVRTEGAKSAVGDEARCIYETGYLIKRVTHIEAGRVYGFVVSEQALDVGGGLRLSGGDYTLRDRGSGTTEIALTTNYVSNRRPRWFWRPIEAFVCHTFHRHILRAMRRAARGGR